jgi:mono/diheme cytochrome c family protein
MKLLVVAALSIALAGCWACKASTPSHFETVVTTRAKRTLFVGNRSTKNPLTDSADHVAAGKEAFSHYCVACHGLDGQNTGVPFADRMSPPVPSLASQHVQAYSDGQLKWIIDNGLSPSGMPASKGILSDEEIWSIVLFLRHLPQPGSLGEPPMYSGECQQPQEGSAGR